ncbi:hypothetical protein CAEBREN_06582 [Caenorhabditis brenneri]|uniref:RING-type domain-containing protein n=1 Tax=Caenorhabditis brenneri TaxID=135651 RepID=G0N3R9_CAEBE|nr:hypothetical protein CAEBREN_06582 [Caenorhabditis brenneri]
MPPSYKIRKFMKFKKNTPATQTINVDWIRHSLGALMSHNLPEGWFNVDEETDNSSGNQRITISYEPNGRLYDEGLRILLTDNLNEAPTRIFQVEVVEEEEKDGARPSGLWGDLPFTHASSLSHSKQASIECQICGEHYSDTISSRIPRILTECGHTLCHSCAETIQKMSPDQISIKCPIDRIVTKVKVEKLHKNFALIDLIRDRSDEEKLAEKMGAVGIYVDPILPCYENPRHEATRYCPSCPADYCDRKCYKKHHKHHDMVTPAEKIDVNHIKLTGLLRSLRFTEIMVSEALKEADRCIKSTSKTGTDYRKMVSLIHEHFNRNKDEAIQNLDSYVEHKREGMELDKKHIEYDMGLIKETKKEIEKVLKRKDLLFAQEIIDKGEAVRSLEDRKEANLVQLSLPSLEEIIGSSKPPIPSHRTPTPPKVPPPPPPRSFRASPILSTFS